MTNVCRACTISQAIGTGSRAWCGRRGVTALALDRDAELVGRRHLRPALQGDEAGGQHREHVEGERAGDRPLGRRVQQPLVEHELRAVVTLLAGLEHEAHAAGQLARVERSGAAPRSRASSCGGRGRRRAWRRRSVTRTRGPCPRASAARPCRPAAGSSGRAGRRRGLRPRSWCSSPVLIASPSPSSASSTRSCVNGSSQAELRVLVEGAAEPHRLTLELLGLGEQRVGRHGRMVRPRPPRAARRPDPAGRGSRRVCGGPGGRAC